MSTLSVGRFGEEAAAGFLQSRGWRILSRNVRHGRGEVDIVASKGRVLAFVEVKCRQDSDHGHPLEAITRGKQREIARVARAWIRERGLPKGTLARFDAVAVFYGPDGSVRIEHVPDAWWLE